MTLHTFCLCIFVFDALFCHRLQVEESSPPGGLPLEDLTLSFGGTTTIPLGVVSGKTKAMTGMIVVGGLSIAKRKSR